MEISANIIVYASIAASIIQLGIVFNYRRRIKLLFDILDRRNQEIAEKLKHDQGRRDLIIRLEINGIIPKGTAESLRCYHMETNPYEVYDPKWIHLIAAQDALKKEDICL